MATAIRREGTLSDVPTERVRRRTDDSFLQREHQVPPGAIDDVWQLEGAAAPSF